jgi:hypothetical protein
VVVAQFGRTLCGSFFKKPKVAAQRGAKQATAVHIVGKNSPLVPRVGAHACSKGSKCAARQQGQAPSKHHQATHACSLPSTKQPPPRPPPPPPPLPPPEKKNLNFGLKFGMQIKKNARNVGKKESGDLEL